MNSIKDNVTRRSVGRPKKIITEKPIHKKVGRPPNPVKIISEEEQKKLSETKRLRPLRDGTDELKTKSLQEYRKQYYLNNKDKFNTDIICVCCKIKLQKSNKSKHLQSKSHLRNFENNQ